MKRLICYDLIIDPPEPGQEVWLYTGDGTMILVHYDPSDDMLNNRFRFWLPKPEYPL